MKAANIKLMILKAIGSKVIKTFRYDCKSYKKVIFCILRKTIDFLCK